MDNLVIAGIIAGVPREADAVGCGVTRNAVSMPKALIPKRILSVSLGLELGGWMGCKESCRVKQKWDCSQVEDDFGEGDVKDW